MFVLTVPGLAPFVRRESTSRLGLDVTETGFDGRADVVFVEPRPRDRRETLGLRTVEDVFVEVGTASRRDADDPRRIAAVLWRPDDVQRALSAWAELVRPLSRSMGFRVVARVLQERSFLRTELRRQVTRAVAQDRPKWKEADPAQLEIWVTETSPGTIVSGLRVSTGAMRQHEGRDAERSGALRPVVASAIVQAAGEADGVLLDPCCGSGTILREARAEGWLPRGMDIDPEAVAIARRNLGDVDLVQGDARETGLPDASVGACVSNLPFGRQFEVQGDPVVWMRAVLGEMARVAEPGAPVVVLCPRVARSSVPAELVPAGRVSITLLGRETTIWSYRRA